LSSFANDGDGLEGLAGLGKPRFLKEKFLRF